MKTIMTAVLVNTVLCTVITTTTFAQRYYNNNGNQINNNTSHNQNGGGNTNNSNYYNNDNDHHNSNNNYTGSYGVYNGGTNGYGYGNNNSSYGGAVYTTFPVINVNMGHNSYGYYRNQAKQALRATRYTINDAQNMSYYNTNYTPFLGLAMRHYSYAKQLYYSQNYAAATNHAQRANDLAQEALYELTAYNNTNNWDYNNGNDDYGFRKNNTATNGTQQRSAQPAQVVKQLQLNELDNQLPASNISDANRVASKLVE